MRPRCQAELDGLVDAAQAGLLGAKVITVLPLPAEEEPRRVAHRSNVGCLACDLILFPHLTEGCACGRAPLVGRIVVISGLVSRPELNGSSHDRASLCGGSMQHPGNVVTGTFGTALDFVEAKGRYAVRFANGERMSLKASCLEEAPAGKRTA